MYIKNVILIFISVISNIIFLSSFDSTKTIKIDDVGDYKPKVDSAIQIIKKYDIQKYYVLMDNCNRVEFIIGNASTTLPPNTISITVSDMNKGVNNVACALVHESYHLKIYNEKIVLPEKQEELEAYKYEYDFICKLPTVEDWLFKNAVDKIILYSR
jgi:hypothetical protein